MALSNFYEPTDLQILQGQTEVMTVTYADSGVGVDISAYTTARLTVANDYLNNGSRTELFTLTDSDGIDLTDALTGIVVVTMSAARTALLTELTYYYDLELQDSGGNVLRLAFGKLYVKPETTN